MKISAKTTITSTAAMAVVMLFSGFVLFLSINSTLGSFERSDASQRMRSIKAVIEEDSLNNKDRATKASLSDDPKQFFPGITYCDVFVYGDTHAHVFSSYVSDKHSDALTDKAVTRAFLTCLNKGTTGNTGLDDYGVLDAGGKLIVYGVTSAKPPVAEPNDPIEEPGFILVGKVMDETYIQKLTRINDYSVSIVEYDSSKLTPAYKQAKAALNDDTAVYSSRVDADWQNAYSLLRDPEGRPVGILRIRDDREQGAAAPYIFILSFLLVFGAGIFVIVSNLLGVRFDLVKRFRDSLATIDRVKTSSDLNHRIKITGRDELAELNTRINDMLTRLQAAHHSDFLSQQLYEKLVEVTHDRVIVFDRDLQVVFINEVATVEYGEKPDALKREDWVSPLTIEQRRRDRERLRKVFSTGAGVHFEEARDFDGESRWVDTWIIPIKDESNKVIQVMVSSRDITERKVAETKTERARDFFLYLFNNFPNPVWRIDAAGRCNYVNKAAVSFTGKEEKNLMGSGWEASVHPDDVTDRANLLDQAAKTKTHIEIEYRLRGFDGTYRWVIDYVQPIFNLRNRFAGFYGTIVDVTERRLKADELAYMATHDILTDTANRRRFEEEIEKTIARARRGEISSLLFMDLDDFKSINDFCGHLVGDKALRAVADTAKRVLRKEDVLNRLGGDEFAVILEGQSVDAALTTAERLVDSVAKTVSVPGEMRLTISVGVTAIGKRSTAAKVMAEADTAMYEAKRRGGSRALIFEKGFIDYNY